MMVIGLIFLMLMLPGMGIAQLDFRASIGTPMVNSEAKKVAIARTGVEGFDTPLDEGSISSNVYGESTLSRFSREEGLIRGGVQ